MLTPEQSAFLAQAHVGVLATTGAAGRPHAAPIWYLYEDGAILMSSGRGSQKHRNAERTPWATLVVDRRELPYYALMVRGRVEVEERLPDDARLRMASRYLGEEQGRRYIESRAAEDSVTLRLIPERVMEYRGASGRES